MNSDGFLAEAAKKSEYIREKLAKCSEVQSLSGIGLMIGIELKTKKAADIAKACLENGLLVLTAKTKVRLLPPLTISYEEIDAGLDILIKMLEG